METLKAIIKRICFCSEEDEREDVIPWCTVPRMPSPPPSSTVSSLNLDANGYLQPRMMASQHSAAASSQGSRHGSLPSNRSGLYDLRSHSGTGSISRSVPPSSEGSKYGSLSSRHSGFYDPTTPFVAGSRSSVSSVPGSVRFPTIASRGSSSASDFLPYNDGICKIPRASTRGSYIMSDHYGSEDGGYGDEFGGLCRIS
jgi:hypothetical protein